MQVSHSNGNFTGTLVDWQLGSGSILTCRWWFRFIPKRQLKRKQHSAAQLDLSFIPNRNWLLLAAPWSISLFESIWLGPRFFGDISYSGSCAIAVQLKSNEIRIGIAGDLRWLLSMVGTMAGCIMPSKSLSVLIWLRSSWLYCGYENHPKLVPSSPQTKLQGMAGLPLRIPCAAVAYRLPSTFSAKWGASHRCKHIRIPIGWY